MNRARTNRYASDDQADDLLADILDTTAESARAEQAERERQLAAKRDADARAKADADAARIAAHQKKLAVELERQSQLAERRTQRLEALRLEAEPAAAAEPAAPAFDEAALRREIADEMREELRALVTTPIPTAMIEDTVAPRVGRPPGLLMGAVVVVVSLGIGLTAFAVQSRYQPDPNPYAKAIFAPLDRDAVALEVATLPIPVTVVDVAAPAPEPAAVRARPKGPRVATPKKPETSFGAPATKSKERKSWEALDAALSGANDPFAITD